MKLGIDIGGTNISLGLVEDGKIIESARTPSFRKEWSEATTLKYLSDSIDKIINDDVDGIGIGVPSVVDIEKGIVYNTANIPSWVEVHLKEYLENIYRIPVEVNNDANCYALGVFASMEKKPRSLVTMTLGTGVGVGIVNEGKLFCGENCGAGELCCLPYDGSSVEDHCSKKFFHDHGWDPSKAYSEATDGNTEAIELFKEYGRNLAFAVGLVLLAYDPQCLVFGGGIAKGSDMFLQEMMNTLKKDFPYPNTIEKLSIAIRNEDNIPVLGAASLLYY